MRGIRLHSGTITNQLIVSNGLSPEQKSTTGLSDIPITGNDVFNANFHANSGENMTYDGAGSNLDLSNLDRYKILRKGTHESTWKYLGDAFQNHEMFQDFLIGSTCSYKYRILPILNTSDGQTVNSIMETSVDIPMLSSVAIIGTIPTEDDEVYEIDYDNIWILVNAVQMDANTLNMGKTFTETLARFPKETVSNKNYLKGGGDGYVGEYLCNLNSYYEDYGLIEAWRNFCSGGSLKILKDLRGNIIPCDIDSEASTTEAYGQQLVTSTRFTYTQLKDEKNISIFHNTVYTYLQTYPILADQDGTLLADQNGLILDAEVENND